jgi:hypothetical protein
MLTSQRLPAQSTTPNSLAAVPAYNITLTLTAIAAALNLPVIEAPALGRKALTKASKQFVKVSGPKGERIQTVNPQFRPEAKSAYKNAVHARLQRKFNLFGLPVPQVLPQQSRHQKVSTNDDLRSSISQSTMIYTALYASDHSKDGIEPGIFADNIKAYNAKASAPNKLTFMHSYGGGLEMYCDGNGGTNKTVVCDDSNMNVYYEPGQLSTAAYAAAFASSEPPIQLLPIIDGRLDDIGPKDVLSALNTLDQQTAYVYADKTAKLYCADAQVAGIYFDLEPLDLTQLGQQYFFSRIAYNLAGFNKIAGSNTDALDCQNTQHPQGRLLALFATANQVNPALATILNTYNNGYIIDPLYDLGEQAGGIASSPTDYATYTLTEIRKMQAASSANNVVYQFAVPGSATAHEFESVEGISTGFKQIDYLNASLSAIEKLNVASDSNYKGTALWAWNSQFYWHNKTFTPAQPSSEVLDFLANYQKTTGTANTTNPTSEPDSNNDTGSSHTKVIIEASVGAGAILLCMVGIFACRPKRARPNLEQNAAAEAVALTRLNRV